MQYFCIIQIHPRIWKPTIPEFADFFTVCAKFWYCFLEFVSYFPTNKSHNFLITPCIKQEKLFWHHTFPGRNKEKICWRKRKENKEISHWRLRKNEWAWLIFDLSLSLFHLFTSLNWNWTFYFFCFIKEGADFKPFLLLFAKASKYVYSLPPILSIRCI